MDKGTGYYNWPNLGHLPTCESEQGEGPVFDSPIGTIWNAGDAIFLRKEGCWLDKNYS